MSVDSVELPWTLKDALMDEGFFDHTPDGIRGELKYWTERIRFSQPVFGHQITCTATARWSDRGAHDFTGSGWTTTIAMAEALVLVLPKRAAIITYREEQARRDREALLDGE